MSASSKPMVASRRPHGQIYPVPHPHQKPENRVLTTSKPYPKDGRHRPYAACPNGRTLRPDLRSRQPGSLRCLGLAQGLLLIDLGEVVVVVLPLLKGLG